MSTRSFLYAVLASSATSTRSSEERYASAIGRRVAGKITGRGLGRFFR